jgi:hypothetical protein
MKLVLLDAFDVTICMSLEPRYDAINSKAVAISTELRAILLNDPSTGGISIKANSIAARPRA